MDFSRALVVLAADSAGFLRVEEKFLDHILIYIIRGRKPRVMEAS